MTEYLYYIPFTAIKPPVEARVEDVEDGTPITHPAVPAHRIFSALTIAMDSRINTPETLVSIAQMIQEQEGVLDATPTGFYLLNDGAQPAALSALQGDMEAMLIEAYMAGLGDAKSEFAGAASATAWANRKMGSLLAASSASIGDSAS